jgi:hypothetical protein
MRWFRVWRAPEGKAIVFAALLGFFAGADLGISSRPRDSGRGTRESGSKDAGIRIRGRGNQDPRTRESGSKGARRMNTKIERGWMKPERIL